MIEQNETNFKTVDEQYIRSIQQKVMRNLTGIYFLLLKDEIVYVGQSTNIISRVYIHAATKDKDFDSFAYIEYPPEVLTEVEAAYIVLFNPSYNGVVPRNSTWVNINALKEKTSLNKVAIKKFIRKNRIKPVIDGYFHINDFAPLLKVEG